jgi:hypothetical protein
MEGPDRLTEKGNGRPWLAQFRTQQRVLGRAPLWRQPRPVGAHRSREFVSKDLIRSDTGLCERDELRIEVLPDIEVLDYAHRHIRSAQSHAPLLDSACYARTERRSFK